jgi:hypothetical protein
MSTQPCGPAPPQATYKDIPEAFAAIQAHAKANGYAFFKRSTTPKRVILSVGSRFILRMLALTGNSFIFFRCLELYSKIICLQRKLLGDVCLIGAHSGLKR